MDRYLEVDPHWVVPNHYFAPACAECLELYRDAYFLSAVMVSQAVNEGIFKLVAERNEIREKKEHHELMSILYNKGAISRDCSDASTRIWRSFRNGVHHMNLKVAEIKLRDLAKRNLQDPVLIEREVFGADVINGKLVPHHPEYWDIAVGKAPNQRMKSDQQ